MSEVQYPPAPKWPFLVGDVLLLGTAAGLAWAAHAGRLPFGTGTAAVIAGAVAAGAWLLTRPYRMEYEAAMRASEQVSLAGTLDQIRLVQQAGRDIQAAVAGFQGAGDAARLARTASEELADRLQSEREAFSAFLQKSNDQDRQAMRLELEKLHRGEQETLNVILHLLDHTFALHQAGVRSGQPGLVQQLGQFRAACLDAVRRLGIAAHEARPGDAFDPEMHETADGTASQPGARIQGTVACGYSIRGVGVRRIVVTVEPVGGGSESAGTAGPGEAGDATA